MAAMDEVAQCASELLRVAFLRVEVSEFLALRESKEPFVLRRAFLFGVA
jgi:hypothetical protein